MSIIEYLPDGLQAFASQAWEYLYSVLIILVPFIDLVFAGILLWSFAEFLMILLAIRDEEEDCAHQDTDANDMLTYMAHDMGIAEALRDSIEEVAAVKEKVLVTDVLPKAANKLRKWDLQQFAWISLVLVCVALVFHTGITLVVLGVQGVVYSICYEYLVPTVFKFRKELNYGLIDGD